MRSVVNQSPCTVTVGGNPKSPFVLRNKKITIHVERGVPSTYIRMYVTVYIRMYVYPALL